MYRYFGELLTRGASSALASGCIDSPLPASASLMRVRHYSEAVGEKEADPNLFRMVEGLFDRGARLHADNLVVDPRNKDTPEQTNNRARGLLQLIKP